MSDFIIGFTIDAMIGFAILSVIAFVVIKLWNKIWND